jgi:hypothetical protein
MSKMVKKCMADFIFLGSIGHTCLTQLMILSSLRAASSQRASRGFCMDYAFSMHWFRNDAHLDPWDGTFHMSSMRQTYASVFCSYICFLMSMRYVSGDRASDLNEPWDGKTYLYTCLEYKSRGWGKTELKLGPEPRVT